MSFIEIEYDENHYTVQYSYEEGLPGDGYLQPDDLPEIKIQHVWGKGVNGQNIPYELEELIIEKIKEERQ